MLLPNVTSNSLAIQRDYFLIFHLTREGFQFRVTKRKHKCSRIHFFQRHSFSIWYGIWTFSNYSSLFSTLPPSTNFSIAAMFYNFHQLTLQFSFLVLLEIIRNKNNDSFSYGGKKLSIRISVQVVPERTHH